MRQKLSAAVIVVSAICVSCQETATAPTVIAQLDGAEVRYQTFSDYVAANVGRQADGLGSAVLSTLLDEFLDAELARALATKEAPAGTPKERLFEVWVDRLPVTEPSEAEVRAAYLRHSDALALPERVLLRQLVAQSFAEAEAARRETVSGADFGQIADRFAEHQFVPAGGLQGVLAAEDLPEQVAEIVFDLPVGEVSRIVELDYGFCLFQVDQKLPEQLRTLDETAGSLRLDILSERRQQALSDRIAEARESLNVTIFAENLPFRYRGRYEEYQNASN